MKSLALDLTAFGSRGHGPNHRPDRRSSRLIARLLALGVAGVLAVASMPAPALATDVVPHPVVGSDWAHFRNGPTRDGNNTSESAISASNVAALGVAWTATTGLQIWSSPVVASGVVYVPSLDAKLYAYAVGCAGGGGTCTPLWTATTGANIDSSPAVAGGVVYLASEDGVLRAYDAVTGTVIWTATPGATASSPAVADGVVYVGSANGKLYAYAVGCNSGGGSCSPLWVSATTGGPISSSPAVAGGVVYVGSQDGHLYAYAVGCASGGGTCSPIWTGTTGDLIHSSPAVANGVVYVGSFDDKLYAFAVGCRSDGGVCSPLWTGATGGAIYSSPAVADGVVYIGSEDFNVYAFGVGCRSDGGVCSPLWTATTGGAIGSSPAVANGVVYIGSSDHNMYGYAVGCASGGATCAPIWTRALGGSITSSPAVSNGVVYVGSLDAKLYAFKIIGATYHALTPPERLVDTRIALGLPGRLTAKVPATFQVTGRGSIPSNATAVTGNVTVVNSSNSWAVYLGPNPVADPSTSTINFSAGETTGNGLTVALSPTGSLSATYMSTAGNMTDLVFDVSGYFTPDMSGATYHPMKPARLLDTRVGIGLGGRLLANTPATFAVRGPGGMPDNAIAVTGNVTVVNPTNSWAVYLGPDPIASPGTSTINFSAGDIKGNNLTVALGTSGTLSATYMSTPGNTADLVFDVTGYYTADAGGTVFVPITPARLLDTRFGNGLGGRLLANTPATFNILGRGVVPAGAQAISGNVTVVAPTFSWAVFLGPDPTPSPGTSNINFGAGDVKGNGLTVVLSGTGSLSATYMSTAGNTTDLVLDVTGYYTP